jgi:hypothetical protein
MGNFTGRFVEARKSFGYAGRRRFIGEVFQLKGLRNDDPLWGLEVDGHPKLGRYTDPFDGDAAKLPKCSECGAVFINHNRLEVHGQNEHKRN